MRWSPREGSALEAFGGTLAEPKIKIYKTTLMIGNGITIADKGK